MFQTSVFPIPPGGQADGRAPLHAALPQEEGLTDFLFPLSTAKYTSHPVEKIDSA